MSLRLSAIVIAKNEAGNIETCLDSLAFCDELIVVDGGSDDETATLAKAKGAKVTIAKEWRGFGHQKNLALSLAAGEWVLSLDADERVSDALAKEIRTAITEGLSDAYEMPRLSTFCGRPHGEVSGALDPAFGLVSGLRVAVVSPQPRAFQRRSGP